VNRWTTLVALLLICLPRVAGTEEEGPILPDVTIVYGGEGVHLRTPASVLVDEKRGELYICDTEANQLVLIKQGRETGRLAIPLPVSAALDAKGQFYVVGMHGDVGIYDFRGQKIGDFRVSGLAADAKPTTGKQIEIDENDAVYLADGANQVLLVTDLGGKVLRRFGALAEGEDGPRFGSIYAFHVSRTRVFVVDGNTCQVSVFGKSSGEFLFQFGERGGDTGKLAVPVSVTTDKEGRIYVLDSLRHCISIFNEDGVYIGECGGEGESPGWFSYPKGMVRDASTGTFYTCEVNFKRVQAFKIPIEKVEQRAQKGGKK